MNKKISLNSTIYEIIEKFPELIDTLYNLGYLGVKNKVMLNTHGRLTSLATGINKLGIDKNKVLLELKKLGFDVIED